MAEYLLSRRYKRGINQSFPRLVSIPFW